MIKKVLYNSMFIKCIIVNFIIFSIFTTIGYIYSLDNLNIRIPLEKPDIKFTYLFIHNIKIIIGTMLFGMLSFSMWSNFKLFVNGLNFGIALAFFSQNKLPFIALCHGLFEMAALIITSSIPIFIIIGLFKKTYKNCYLIKISLITISIYIIIALLLTFIAAILEVYVSYNYIWN